MPAYDTFLWFFQLDIPYFSQVVDDFSRAGIYLGKTYGSAVFECYEHTIVVVETYSLRCVFECQFAGDVQFPGQQVADVYFNDFLFVIQGGVDIPLLVASDGIEIEIRIFPARTRCNRGYGARRLCGYAMFGHGTHGIQNTVYYTVVYGDRICAARRAQKIFASVGVAIQHIDAAAEAGNIDFIVRTADTCRYSESNLLARFRIFL